MPIEVTMPALSPTMEEGTLAKWTVKEGDSIAPGDVIAEIETDKATMEVESVDEGVVGKFLVKAGTENVPVNKVIALLLEEGEDKKALESYKPKEEPKKEAEAETTEEDSSDEKASKAEASDSGSVAVQQKVSKAPEGPTAEAAPAHGAAAVGAGERAKASPLAKRIAKDAGVSLDQVVGSGPKGRVIKADVEEAVRSGTGAVRNVKRHPVEFVKVQNNNMRKVIAKRLTESKQQVPHFYLTVECEIDKLLDVRKVLNGKAAAKAGPDGKPLYKVSVNDMIIKAVALAMRDIPSVNGSWYDDAVVYYNNVDVSVAVAIDGGLVTPVLRNADQKSLPQISGEVKDFAGRARIGKLAPEEMQGGGFSVSNLGMFGIKEFGAIINPPQSCILAVGAGEERAVVHNGELRPATVMSTTLSVDHRVVDGALGAEFLAAFKQYIEEPVLLFV
jgi:pyruvate dehydrogenase E2 component (dihydrolipoamide acetyltransferase)